MQNIIQNRSILSAAVLFVAFFAFAGFASAASIPATAIFDGQTQVWGTPGQSKQVTARINANAGEVVHAVRVDFLGDNQPTKCIDISNFEGAQEKDVSVNVTLPPNTGDYGFEAVPFYTNNMPAANALTGDAACANTTGNNAGATYNQGNVVHVTPTGTGSTGTVGGTNSLSDLWAAIASLTESVKALVEKENSTPDTTKPACPPLYNGFNRVAVQTWLMNNGYESGFNSVGIYSTSQLSASNVVWGNISNSAYSAALAACK